MLDASWVQPIIQGFAWMAFISLLCMGFMVVVTAIGARAGYALTVVLIYVFCALMVAKFIHG